MMKKIVYMAAVALAITAASCSGNKRAEDKGADLKAKIENCTNPDSLKLYVQQAREYAEKLIAEGKDTEAKAYLGEVIPAVTSKDPSMVQTLTLEADSAATAIKDKASAVADSVSAKAGEVKDSVASKAGKAVDAAKSAAADAAQKASDKVSSAASDAAGKVKDALSK